MLEEKGRVSGYLWAIVLEGYILHRLDFQEGKTPMPEVRASDFLLIPFRLFYLLQSSPDLPTSSNNTQTTQLTIGLPFQTRPCLESGPSPKRLWQRPIQATKKKFSYQRRIIKRKSDQSDQPTSIRSGEPKPFSGLFS